jgi:hypothetical protein
MSQYRIWITADELMKRLGIGPLDLADYVLKEKLTAYNSYNKTPIDLAYEQKSFYDKLEYWQEIYGESIIWMGLPDLASLEDRIFHYIFDYKQVVGFELNFNQQKGIKLRPDQRHKEECRQIARSIWQQMPNLTIIDVIRMDEVNKIRCAKKPNPYGEKTVREWINDLCPNRKPGRRPKLK